jgi:hypothetical protein
MQRICTSNRQIKLVIEILVVVAIIGLGCSTATSIPSTPTIIETPVVTPMLTPKNSQATPSDSFGQATFSGKFKDLGYDTNNDGQFEFLQVDIEINVTQAGGFGFTTGLLDSNEQLIAIGSLTTDTSRNAPLASTRLAVGLQNVSIYFLGSSIRSSGVNGPYSVGVTLADEAGNIVASSSFTTQAYNYRIFEKNVP